MKHHKKHNIKKSEDIRKQPQKEVADTPCDEQQLNKHTKAIVAVSFQLLLGVCSIGLGIGISIYGHGFEGFPILTGIALVALAAALIVREVKARNRVKERIAKQRMLREKYNNYAEKDIQ